MKKPKNNKPTIYFYRKTGCHLCDDMARGLIEFEHEMKSDSEIKFKVIARDIESNEQWYQRYREYVPTLVIDEREICYYFLDKAELKAALTESK